MRDDMRELARHYDRNYYLNCIGEMDEPYVRGNQHWRRIFDEVAQAIVTELRPKTVLDAGCGIGFLVEALRERGVEAWGFDISDYAISQVPEEIRPYCWVGSVTEDLDDTYDLITCIEVLEHLPPELAPRAVENLTGHTKNVLFSSTPEDFREPTHLNVQPVEYWAGLFGRYGFFRDLRFDASFITAHAVLFRRISGLPISVLRDYERWHSRTLAEVRALRAANLAAEEELAALRPLQQTSEEVENLRKMLEEQSAQLESAVSEAERLRPYEQTVEDQAKHIEALEARVAALSARQVELRKMLLDAHQQLFQRDEEFGRVRAEELQARDEEIEWLRGILHTRDEEIEWLRGVAADREERLASMANTRTWRLAERYWRIKRWPKR
jgi:SAM-dependent methyltransferase